MDRELRILVLEDSPADAELLERELRKGGLPFTVRRVQTRETFLKELDEFHPDIVLADYALPSFDGLKALELVRQRPDEIPYIFVSGSIGEERAVQALKSGATDYLLKGHLTRLVPAVLRAIREVEEHAQIRKFEDQSRQVQKLEAIGRLAGGVAHDFNNLLTVISGYSDMILKRADLDSALRRHVEEIKKAGERAAALTGQLLAFSRRQVLNLRVIDLNAEVGEIDKMLRRLIGEDLDLATLCAPDLGRVRADPGQVQQVIMNLAINARDAMPDGGKLTIETSNVELDAEYARRHTAVAAGRYVMLAVSDNGCGMDEATQARIFEPFFTTKEKGKGTGLGLATVYGIVKQSGGNIWVYSEIGKGTTFKLYFPRVDEPAERARPASERLRPARGNETILLVEDDASVRALVRGVLEGRGYAILEAATPGEALKISGAKTGRIHLMVTDVVMPLMSGRQLAEKLAPLRPAMKVLYLSGYTENAIVHHGVLEPGIAFLQKPFTPESLARKVRDLLDANPP